MHFPLPWYMARKTLAGLFLLGFSLGMLAEGSWQTDPQQRRRYESPSGSSEIVYQNMGKIDSLETRVARIEAWQDSHESRSETNTAVLEGNVRELQTMVAAHDKLLWLMIVMMMSVVGKLVYDYITKMRHGEGHVTHRRNSHYE